MPSHPRDDSPSDVRDTARGDSPSGAGGDSFSGVGPATRVGPLDARFSGLGATAREWSEVSARLRTAETYWLTTVRSGGRPHTTPLLGIWRDEVLYFATGREEQKARNLELSPYCTMTAGSHLLNEGLDVVVEGVARQATEAAELERLADAFGAKYGAPWRFDMGGEDVRPLMFRVESRKILAFGKGEPFSQTAWRAFA